MESLEECYTVCGMGGWESCLVVQEKLQRYGLCSFTRWDPGPDFSDDGDQEFPSHWRFFFETNLKPADALALLGIYAARYQIKMK